MEWIIIIFGVIQLVVFFYTFRRINLFVEIFPKDSYETEIQSHFNGMYTLVKISEYASSTFETIANNINAFVKNNPDSADFDMVSSIVERENDAIEESILQTISVPLYIGLMGTMFGVFIGLYNIDTEDLTNENGIISLLGSVKWAMLVSFSGLLLVTINNSIIYRLAKIENTKQKNRFYNFLQIELFPTMSGVDSMLTRFKKQLDGFNDAFGENVSGFKGSMDLISTNIKSQDKVFERIENLDINNLSTILNEIRNNIEQFEKFNKNISESKNNFLKFNEYLQNISSYVDNSNRLIDKSEEIHKKLSSFGANAEEVANGIKARLADSNNLMKFLNGHFNVLQEMGDSFENKLKVIDNDFTNKITELTKHSTEAVSAHIQQFSDSTEDINKIYQKYGVEFSSKLQTVLDKMVKNLNDLGEKNEKLDIEIHQGLKERSHNIPIVMNKIDDALVKGFESMESIISDFKNRLSIEEVDVKKFFRESIQKEDIYRLQSIIAENSINSRNEVKEEIEKLISVLDTNSSNTELKEAIAKLIQKDELEAIKSSMQENNNVGKIRKKNIPNKARVKKNENEVKVKGSKGKKSPQDVNIEWGKGMKYLFSKILKIKK